MIFVIEGKEYDVEQGLAKVTLNTLFELKAKHGISAKDLQIMAQYLSKFNGKPAEELLDDKMAIRSLMVIIWLARKHAGERITLEQACEFDMTEFYIKAEDEPEPEDEADPKATEDSVPADAAPVALNT